MRIKYYLQPSINRLFLYLSKFRTCMTNEEIKLNNMLVESNEVLRSCYSIVQRRGEQTNWDGIQSRLFRLLEDQHKRAMDDI